MILLTLDRFLNVYFNIKCHLYWTSKTSKIALLSATVFSILVSVTWYLLSQQNFVSKSQMLVYILIVLDLSFVIIATITYSYMYYKIRSLRKLDLNQKRCTATIEAGRRNDLTVQKRAKQTAKDVKSGFYFPTLIIVNFLIFWTTPDLVFCVFTVNKIHLNRQLKHVMHLFYPIGIVLDAIFYLTLPYMEVIRRIFRPARSRREVCTKLQEKTLQAGTRTNSTSM